MYELKNLALLMFGGQSIESKTITNKESSKFGFTDDEEKRFNERYKDKKNRYEINIRYFPNVKNLEIYNNLKLSYLCYRSITHPNHAIEISKMIINQLNRIKKENKYSIMDATASCGGNTLSFATLFNKVTAIELIPETCEMLKTNVKLYDFNNVEIVCGDCIDNLDRKHDAYFFDPPWGGNLYREKNKLNLSLSNYTMPMIVDYIKKYNSDSVICFKLPYNYDESLLSKYKPIIYKLYTKPNKYFNVYLV
jgi:predicted RNA methylase